MHGTDAGQEKPVLIRIWIFWWNLFHFQDRRIPVKIVLSGELHRKSRIVYYQVRRHRHVRA